MQKEVNLNKKSPWKVGVVRRLSMRLGKYSSRN
jgi:hypothetical protein